MVPSLLDICALAGGRDATAEPEDEDVLFGRDGAEPDLEADDDDDDDDNLAESWTVAQAQEARADVGRTDLDDMLAAAGRCDQEAAAAGEGLRASTIEVCARAQPTRPAMHGLNLQPGLNSHTLHVIDRRWVLLELVDPERYTESVTKAKKRERA